MKKNTTKMTVLILIAAMMSICMFTACGDAIDTTDSQQEEIDQEEIDQEEIDQEETSDDESAIERLRDLTKIKDLEQKNIILVDIYNEVANLAVANGWDADAATVEDLYNADTYILLFNDVIMDQTGITVEDLDELLLLVDEITPQLDINIRERVSVPYSVAE